MRYYVIIIAALAAVAMTPVSTPQPTPAPVYDCDTLASAQDDAYWTFYAGLSRDEQAVVRAAWNSRSWQNMSATDLYTAIILYEQWARDVGERIDDQPAPIRPYLRAEQLNLRYLAREIDSWAEGGGKPLDDIAASSMVLWEKMYEMAVEGVAQCGQQWIDVFGEPWNPHGTDATPAASHHVVRL